MTKRLFLTVSVLCVTISAVAQRLPVVPIPVQMKTLEEPFRLDTHATLTVSAPSFPKDSIYNLCCRLSNECRTLYGLKLKVRRNAQQANIVLVTNRTMNAEDYRLKITNQKIHIEAARPVGFFYAFQTIKQLVSCQQDNGQLTIPAVEIADSPRFGWRGFMLDEGRHFFGKETVKRVLDIMATYKMNRFHWHLTEDQGWRIQINKYPKLTETGAWRNSRTLAWGDTPTDGEHYGGFYTQKDIREIIAYARDRFIEIVPEIDLPGHSQAAVASYPEMLACDPEQPHEVWLKQGVSTDVINVANPQAVQFAKDVIAEITELFPFSYLHLGGDECPTAKWEKNVSCQSLLKELGSTNYRDLQLHFYRQLQDYIATLPAKRQRRLIFWNEFIQGNTALLREKPVIMAWVGADRAARTAAERGFDVILTPQIPYYINRRQAAGPDEPKTQGNGSETVEAVYGYVPAKDVPAQLMPHYMGVQGNFWSEWVDSQPIIEYLILPRIAAIAEAGWSLQAQRDFQDFKTRILPHAKLYRHNGWNYGKHLWNEKK